MFVAAESDLTRPHPIPPVHKRNLEQSNFKYLHWLKESLVKSRGRQGTEEPLTLNNELNRTIEEYPLLTDPH